METLDSIINDKPINNDIKPSDTQIPPPSSNPIPIPNPSPNINPNPVEPKPKKEKKIPKYVYYNQKPVNPAKYTDSDNSEDEGLEDYKMNGYHPVHIGEVLMERYVIMQKLGWGHFSTAWLAKDIKFNTYVAIKIQKSAQQYIDAAYDEVEILQELEKHNFDPEWVRSVKEYWQDEPEKIKNGVQRDHSQIVQLLNSFIYHGQNGRHFCMVFEIMGVTLLEIIKRYNYKGIPLPYVRVITKQILIGLDFLHRMCGIIHTDLKPENVLVCLTPSELKEIEESGYMDITKLKNKKGDKNKEPKNKDKEQIKNEISAQLDKKCFEKENDESMTITTESGVMDKPNGKKMRKKNQRYKRKQIKKLEKQGYSPNEIEEKIKEIMEKKKSETSRQMAEQGVDIQNYNVEDLIDRPRVASVPKYTIKGDNDTNSEDEEDNDPFEFDIMDYSKSLQVYLKEKNRIVTDENYRLEVMTKSKLLKEAKTDKEKSQVIKDLQEKFNRRGPGIDFNIRVKICDMGNACWFTHHFSTEIQTRQYRSPEVLLGINYNETADLWSLACMVFELVTGDYLFEPRKGENYSKNDDHIAQFIELLGRMPKKFALNGGNSNKHFNKQGELRRIKGLQFFFIDEILMKKYKIKHNEAKALADFLLPMLEYYPEKRASAREMLNHPWLKMEPNFDYLMSDWEVEKMNLIANNKKEMKEKEEKEEKSTKDNRHVESSDSSINGADSEDNSDFDVNDENILGGEDGFMDDNPDKIQIQNFNNSFAQYGQFVDLAALDRANPQFEDLD